MGFTAILGNQGSGKTCLMTYLLWREFKAGRKIIANYNLNFPHTYMPFEEIRKIPRGIENSVLGLDELGIGADSYEFFSSDVKKITELILQLRKLGIDAYYTAQRFNLVTRRLRQQTGEFIFMRDLDAGTYELALPNGETQKVDQHWEICRGFFELRYMNDNEEFIGYPVVFDGRSMWNKYNHRELIRK